jgi:AcrR family transcriptional regulator
MKMTAPASNPARDARRQGILDVAREVFLAEGYAAASMSTIAARVGGSKGTLYNYFRSKEELFEAFIRNECAAEADAAFTIAPEETDVRRALMGLGERVATFLLSDLVVAIHRLVIAEAGRFPELGRALYAAGPKQRVARLGDYLKAQMDAGRLRRADHQRAAEQFIALCRAGLHEARLWNLAERPTPEDIRLNVEAAVSTFMAAYGP